MGGAPSSPKRLRLFKLTVAQNRHKPGNLFDTHTRTHSLTTLSLLSTLSIHTQVLDLKTALLTNSSVHTLGLANAHLGEAGGVSLADVVEGVTA